MACFEHGTIIDLAARESVSLPDIRGTTLRVTRGTLWITQENDTQDIVLRAGDTWMVEKNGLTIIEAQEDTTFCALGRRFELGGAAIAQRTRRRRSSRACSHAFAAFFASADAQSAAVRVTRTAATPQGDIRHASRHPDAARAARRRRSSTRSSTACIGRSSPRACPRPTASSACWNSPPTTFASIPATPILRRRGRTTSR